VSSSLFAHQESNGNVERIRDVYERAIANVPPVVAKDAWRRYIYLWIQVRPDCPLRPELHARAKTNRSFSPHEKTGGIISGSTVALSIIVSCFSKRICGQYLG
jgi:hypothetical protein